MGSLFNYPPFRDPQVWKSAVASKIRVPYGKQIEERLVLSVYACVCMCMFKLGKVKILSVWVGTQRGGWGGGKVKCETFKLALAGLVHWIVYRPAD